MREWQSGIDGGADVGELADNIEFVVVDGDDWKCHCIPWCSSSSD